MGGFLIMNGYPLLHLYIRSVMQIKRKATYTKFISSIYTLKFKLISLNIELSALIRENSL